MKNKVSIITFSLLVFLSVSSYSQDDDLNYFTGKWNFKIWFIGNDSDTPDLRAEWFLEKSLDSASCFSGYVQLPSGTYTRELIALNPVSQEYIRTVMANDGALTILKTSGWEGDKMVWIGAQYFNGKRIEIKEEITKSGPDNFSALFYTLQDNEWVKMQKEVLTRIDSIINTVS